MHHRSFVSLALSVHTAMDRFAVKVKVPVIVTSQRIQNFTSAIDPSSSDIEGVQQWCRARESLGDLTFQFQP